MCVNSDYFFLSCQRTFLIDETYLYYSSLTFTHKWDNFVFRLHNWSQPISRRQTHTYQIQSHSGLHDERLPAYRLLNFTLYFCLSFCFKFTACHLWLCNEHLKCLPLCTASPPGGTHMSKYTGDVPRKFG